MQCLCPTYAAMRPDPHKKGKNELVFGFDAYQSASKFPSTGWVPVLLPCGRCLACKMRRAKEWAIRATHEAQMHQDNCFLTLTYDDEHLPKDYSVSVRAIQLFMKRLRKSIAPQKVRYLACGEYGSLNGRPHYHLCLFGYCPDDLIDTSGYGISKYYYSQKIHKLWPFGFHTIGELNEKSAAYVARYTVKKAAVLDERREDGRTPEFMTCSRKPGLGYEWFVKYWKDVYNYDVVISKNGSKSRPPKRYDAWLAEISPSDSARVLSRRHDYSSAHPVNDDYQRINTLTELAEIRSKQLHRTMEEVMNMDKD